jgi:hypothetical protein
MERTRKKLGLFNPNEKKLQFFVSIENMNAKLKKIEEKLHFESLLKQQQ